jgi:hypothetical protein
MIQSAREWTLFDYVDLRKSNAIKEWTRGLEKRSLAKLNRKLEILEQTGPDLAPGLLKGTRLRHVDKVKVEGRVSHALLVCRGPIHLQEEMTLLLGVPEKDRKLPLGSEQKADERRLEVAENALERRCLHERLSWPT